MSLSYEDDGDITSSLISSLFSLFCQKPSDVATACHHLRLFRFFFIQKNNKMFLVKVVCKVERWRHDTFCYRSVFLSFIEYNICVIDVLLFSYYMHSHSICRLFLKQERKKNCDFFSENVATRHVTGFFQRNQGFRNAKNRDI
jgi:hypothetical protein